MKHSIDNIGEFTDIIDCFKGQPVYIVCASPDLNDLDQEDLRLLRGKNIIAGNYTGLIIDSPHLFVSSYTHMCLLQKVLCKHTKILKLCTVYEKKCPPGFVRLVKGPYDHIEGLSRIISKEQAYISTDRNQALGMLHIALITGASEAIFMGVSQASHCYFWQLDPNLKQRLEMAVRLICSPLYDHLIIERPDEYARYINALNAVLSKTSEESMRTPFYFDFKDLFASFMIDCESYGMRVFSVSQDSVLTRAGARYISTKKALKEF